MNNNITHSLPRCSYTSQKQTPLYVGDRFIPTRMPTSKIPENPFEPRTLSSIALENRLNTYTSKLTPQALNKPPRKSILFFGSPEHHHTPSNNKQNITPHRTQKARRNISLERLRILDAPNFEDNFYNNPITWSVSERVSIALNTTEGGTIFSISPNASKTNENITNPEALDDQMACALASLDHENTVSGWDNGFIRLHQSITARDYHYQTRASTGSIRSIAVTSPQTIICADTYGSLTSVDFRAKTVTTLHTSTASSTPDVNQIPGLTYDNHTYLASGSNDGTVNLWDIRKFAEGPLLTHTFHKAATKALTFWPKSKQFLISGGGTACRNLCLWDIGTNQIKYKIDTGSQITGIHCFKHEPRYFVTSHGVTDPSLKLWHIKSHQISLHLSHSLGSGRAISLTGSPNTHDIATVTAEEALHFFRPSGLNGNAPTNTHKSSILPPELSNGLVIR